MGGLRKGNERKATWDLRSGLLIPLDVVLSFLIPQLSILGIIWALALLRFLVLLTMFVPWLTLLILGHFGTSFT